LTADPNGYLIGSGSEEDRRRNLEAFSSKLTDLRTEMENSDESISQTIETLRRASSNPGAQYYWLVFVFMYAGVYLFQ
jgi:nicotinic acid mononucleotide adenylyltransferase